MRKYPIVALIYDFDGTLSPGNMQEFGFIQAIGKKPQEFWQESDAIALGQDASNILSYMKLMFDEAKKAGIKVTAETCPHYFAATDEIIRGYDTNTKVNPPIREEKDRLAIIEGLKDGTLDCIVKAFVIVCKTCKVVLFNELVKCLLG